VSQFYAQVVIYNMKHIQQALYISILVIFCGIYPVYGQAAPQTARVFIGPTISDTTTTSAIFRLSRETLEALIATNSDAVTNGYFEYYKKNQICPAIYPTPEYCLPKKTTLGVTSIKVTDLIPNTEYQVVYKKDNTIACVTTPCPTNSFTSLVAEFKTPISGTSTTPTEIKHLLTKNIGYRSRGVDVQSLQLFLIQKNFLDTQATGYFGDRTRTAVKAYQSSVGIPPTGYVGVLTRAKIDTTQTTSPTTTEYFEGTITAVSTRCFSDGECSITVDDKKVITTIGWSQEKVGSIFGSVTTIGDATNKIGSRAQVYAQKKNGIYTLYGASEYYIQIL
jgi:peptidoglycan hydrolase-like protein with peptidoglycan-binding domain